MNILIIGDTWEFEYIVKDNQNKIFDFSNYAIRAEIKDNANNRIKIANSLVNGGSNTQIYYDNDRLFLIFPLGKTATMISGSAILEVEITSSDGKRYTIIQDSYVIKPDLIKWDSV